MGSDIPKGKRHCIRCGGNKTQTETYTVPVGGASRETTTQTRVIPCKVCHGRGYN